MDKEQNKTQSNISINITSTGCLKDVEAQCSKDKLLRTPKNFPRAPKSPDSALKSQKKLEWDSLGDIGYRSNSNSDSISTLERSVLKDFFAKRGIKVNFSSKQKNLGKLFASLKNVSEVSKSKEDSEEKTEDFKSGKLVNIPHSTPKTPLIENPETQESSEALPIEINTFQDGIQELKYDSSQKSSPENSNVSEKIEDQNKYCQTSKILTKDQYVQADCSNNNSKSNTCSFPSTTFTSENTASSFEYLDPNTENKENVKSVKIKTEVELGVKLLCSLIESNNLSSNQKTKLARSIVKRLTKSNNIENIMMNCSDSMSDTSLQNVKSFLSKLNPKSKDFERNFMENGTQTSPNNKISQSHNESNYISRNPISKINEKTETKCTQTSSELTDRFEKRLNDIEAEIKKISLYKQKLIASNDSQRLIAGQENPSGIIEESRTVLQRETEKYEDKAYNPLNMYRRSTNKSVYTTTIYKNNKSNKISKTKIEINEEQPMFAKDID
uniref:Uncharacterized protein n=1 Tax=Megaselia scalaris TaxID=36166 RepID=T1GK88_MEGSC